MHWERNTWHSGYWHIKLSTHVFLVLSSGIFSPLKKASDIHCEDEQIELSAICWSSWLLHSCLILFGVRYACMCVYVSHYRQHLHPQNFMLRVNNIQNITNNSTSTCFYVYLIHWWRMLFNTTSQTILRPPHTN